MRVYAEVARRTFHRMTTYRGATAAGAFTNTVFGFLLAYVLLAVYAERPEVGGFGPVDAVTFTFVAQGLIMTVGMFGNKRDDGAHPHRRRGRRPLPAGGLPALVGLGRLREGRVLRRVPRRPPLPGGGAGLRPPPARRRRLALFLASVAAAVAVAFGWQFLLGLSAFWLLDDRGATNIGLLAAMFLSGVFVPVVFFPGWLEALARALPFASMVQVPAEVFLGKHPGTAAASAVAGQPPGPRRSRRPGERAVPGRAAGGGAGWVRPGCGGRPRSPPSRWPAPSTSPPRRCGARRSATTAAPGC